ncbi:MAG: Rrf2 family transcriptional regulator [Candidatus Paceibacterota bacterium]
MKINAQTRYGLQAMVYLARNKGKVLTLKEIAKAQGAPLPYLEKILSKLEKANLLESRKGKSGGYIFSKNPKSISVKEIFEAADKKLALISCLGGVSCSKQNCCRTKVIWAKLQNAMLETLNDAKLSDLIK